MSRKTSSRKQAENKKAAAQQAKNTSGHSVPKPASEAQDVERKIGQFSEAGNPPLIKK